MKLNNLFTLYRQQLQVPLAGIFIAFSILTDVTKPLLANESPMSSSLQAFVGAEGLAKDNLATKGKLPQADGIYLYSQSPQPQQIGQEYMVFEMRQGKVTGAFYLPYSEFSCFHGTLKSGELALTVANAPEVTPEPNLTAVQTQQLAAVGNSNVENNYNPSMAYPYAVALQNYYQLPDVSDSDRRLLRTCTSYQQ